MESKFSKIFNGKSSSFAKYVVVAGLTLTIYWFWLGKSHKKRREQLEKDLEQAHHTVRDLEDKLISLEQTNLENNGKEIRIWMDGAFDMMHYGHMNAFRQGRSLGTYLIVGVNSDETITACKGEPVCKEKERVATVKGCKWVDEVVEGVPYIMNKEYLKYVIEKYNIDYVVHGDDPCIVDGKDVYESARKMGKYLTIPRTEGISTTDIVGRMLLMTRSHHSPHISDKDASQSLKSNEKTPEKLLLASGRSSDANNETLTPFDRKTNFLTTSRILRLFGAGVRAPKPNERVVYLAGAWDMFHSGHIETLEKARKFGEYIIVGVHNDNVVNKQRGMNLPIMNLNERVLSVLGCKWVDDVLIDAPYVITKDVIKFLHIDVVVKGTANPTNHPGNSLNDMTNVDLDEVYKVPKAMGILQTIESSNFTDCLMPKS